MHDDYFLSLESILQTRAFDRLGEFREESVLTHLGAEEKGLLALILILHGEEELEREEEASAMALFDEAVALTGSDPNIFHHIGEVLFQHGKVSSDLQFLLKAKESLEKALHAAPFHFITLHTLGILHAYIGLMRDEGAPFQRADDLFTSNEKLCAVKTPEECFAFYWDWAHARYLHGKHSEEVVDFCAALEKFQKALTFSPGNVTFWHEYGCTLITVAEMLSSVEFFSQAKQIYELCITHDPQWFRGWFYLGVVYHELFELSGKEEDYHKAVRAYEEAVRLKDDEVELWVRFGHIQVAYGKLEHDLDAVESSLEKFTKAESLDLEHSLVYSGLGEAYMVLGIYREDLSLLMEAKNKIMKGLELSPKQPDIWGCLGSCLYELGRYFQDESYLRSSIEKFQQGIALDGRRVLLWFGLSRAQFALADLKKEATVVEESVYSAMRATNLRKAIPLFWTNHAICLIHAAELTQHRHYVESAIEKLETAITLFNRNEEHPLYLETLFHYGYALDFLGDFDLESTMYQKAIQVLSIVIAREPAYFQARYTLACSLMHLGELNDDVSVLHEAKEHFHKLLEEDPEDCIVASDFGSIYLNLAYLARDTGRPELETQYLEDAEALLQQSVALGGSHSYYYLACLYSMRKQLDAAMYYIGKSETAQVLPTLDELLHDEWLEELRDTAEFSQFIQKLKLRP